MGKEDIKNITAVPTEIKTKINKTSNTDGLFLGLHINIRNAGKNMDELKHMIKETNIEYDVVGLTECWCTAEEAKNWNLNIDNYDCIYGKEKYNQNGGVGLYINRKYEWCECINGIKEAESLSIEIKEKGGSENNYVIILIYRNPNRKEELKRDSIE